MNIKQLTQNAVIGLTAIIASSCVKKDTIPSDYKEVLVTSNIFSRDVQVEYKTYTDSSLYYLDMKDTDGNGWVNTAEERYTIHKNGMTQDKITSYNKYIPYRLQSIFDEAIITYNTNSLMQLDQKKNSRSK